MAIHASVSDTLSNSDSPSFERGRGSAALALRYAAFAVCAAALAPLLRAFAWLPLWLALSNALIAYAYACNRVAVFGKRRDGAIAPLNLVLMLPYLLLVWAFFWLKVLGLRPEPCWHQVAPGIYLGRKPRAPELPPDCRMVVDLTCEFFEERAVTGGYAYRCLPILNRHVPGDAELCALLDDLRDFAEPVYLHCGAGRGRSAMVAAALLVLRGLSPDVADAERTLRRARPGVRLHAAQVVLIERLCARLRRGAARQNQPPSATPKCA
jgi:protein-tyrosine phosphatase